MAEENTMFYIIIGKKTPLSEAKSKLVKYYLVKQKSVTNENIFEFVDDMLTIADAGNLIKECGTILKNVTIILLPINNSTGSDGKTTKDCIFKEKLIREKQKCYFYNEFLTTSNSK